MTPELFLRPLFDWRSAVASKHGPEKPTTRFVLLTLSLHMSVKGDSCFPSIDLLAEESGLSRRAIIEHLQLAEASGWISKRDRSARSGQGWRRVEYFALIPNGVEAALRNPVGEKLVQEDHHLEGGDRSAEGGDRDSKKVVHQGHLSTSSKPSKSKSPARALISDLQLPDWITPEAWAGYEAMRLKIRKPMTDRARGLVLKKLVSLKEQGHDPIAVLEQSERNSWTDVYPIKPEGANGQAGGQQRWWESDTAMEAMAKQHGVSTLGKTRFQLKAAIEEKLGRAH